MDVRGGQEARVDARDGAKGTGTCTRHNDGRARWVRGNWRCIQAVEGANERWQVVLLSFFSFFSGRMRTGSDCARVRVYTGLRRERVGANKLRGVVSAVNSSNGQYLPFIPFFWLGEGWVESETARI